MIISFAKVVLQKDYSRTVFVAIFSVTLLLTGARTAAISGVLGIFIFYMTLYGFIRGSKKLISGTLLFGLVMILILGLLVYYDIFDLGAFSQIYNAEKMSQTMGVMLGKSETFELYFSQISHNPLSLLFGLGGHSPDIGLRSTLSSFSDDDIFILSLISRYGLLLLMFILSFSFLVLRVRRCMQWRLPMNYVFLMTVSIGVISAMMISAIHTDAMYKPQLFPVFIIFLSIVSSVAYQKKDLWVYRQTKHV